MTVLAACWLLLGSAFLSATLLPGSSEAVLFGHSDACMCLPCYINPMVALSRIRPGSLRARQRGATNACADACMCTSPEVACTHWAFELQCARYTVLGSCCQASHPSVPLAHAAPDALTLLSHWPMPPQMLHSRAVQRFSLETDTCGASVMPNTVSSNVSVKNLSLRGARTWPGPQALSF